MDVKVVDLEIFWGNVLVTFSDGKVAICNAEELHKIALDPEVLLGENPCSTGEGLRLYAHGAIHR